MQRSQKHEWQSHEKRRNEDHGKILQNTAPVCGKAGIDLLNGGKKVRTPSACADERGSAEKQIVCDHSRTSSASEIKKMTKSRTMRLLSMGIPART